MAVEHTLWRAGNGLFYTSEERAVLENSISAVVSDMTGRAYGDETIREIVRDMLRRPHIYRQLLDAAEAYSALNNRTTDRERLAKSIPNDDRIGMRAVDLSTPEAEDLV